MKNKDYIVIDTESTDLLKPMGTALYLQPHIVEIYAAVLDKEFNIVEDFESLIKAPVPISASAFKVNKITEEILKDAPRFKEIFCSLFEIFLGCRELVAAGLYFDLEMLKLELERCGRLFRFPYPPLHFCTIEKSLHLKGYRLKNSELYEIAIGKELVGAHRAKADVMATIENLKFLKEAK